MKNLLLISLSLIIGTTLISGVLNNGGSPGRKTGSPLDGNSCAQCHSSSVTEVSWISTNIPETGWIPGEKYTITLSAEHESAAKFGFEITAENSQEKQGAFIITDDSRTRSLNQNLAVTHSSAGTAPTGSKITWEMDWLAPETNAGEINFYAAINAADGNGSTSGDKIYTSSISFAQTPTTGFTVEKTLPEIFIYPNPATDFVIVKSRFEIFEINLYTLIGERILTQTKFSAFENTINTNELEKGIYVLTISTKEGAFSYKLIK